MERSEQSRVDDDMIGMMEDDGERDRNGGVRHSKRGAPRHIKMDSNRVQ